MSNPLDPVMGWYKVTLGSMHVTARVLEKGVRDAVPDKSTFYGRPTSEGLDRIKAAEQQVEDLVVLSLVSTFERRVRDHLAGLPRVSTFGRDDVDERVRRQIVSDMEYWKLSEEVLTLFAGPVHRDLIGRVKQAVDYRELGRPRAFRRPAPKSTSSRVRLPDLDRIRIDRTGLL